MIVVCCLTENASKIQFFVVQLATQNSQRYVASHGIVVVHMAFCRWFLIRERRKLKLVVREIGSVIVGCCPTGDTHKTHSFVVRLATQYSWRPSASDVILVVHTAFSR